MQKQFIYLWAFLFLREVCEELKQHAVPLEKEFAFSPEEVDVRFEMQFEDVIFMNVF